MRVQIWIIPWTCSLFYAVPPQMYLHPMDEIIRIDSYTTSVTLTCMAGGSQSYHWQREVGSIQPNAVGINSSNLTLRDILPSDGGCYRCVAVNKHGMTYSNYAMLIVEGMCLQAMYTITIFLYSIVHPPVVTIIPGGEVVFKGGDNPKFICSATGVGFDDFKYQWFLNNDPVPGHDVSTLIITPVLESNTGGYTCSVLNSYGGIGRPNNSVVLILGT